MLRCSASVLNRADTVVTWLDRSSRGCFASQVHCSFHSTCHHSHYTHDFTHAAMDDNRALDGVLPSPPPFTQRQQSHTTNPKAEGGALCAGMPSTISITLALPSPTPPAGPHTTACHSTRHDKNTSLSPSVASAYSFITQCSWFHVPWYRHSDGTAGGYQLLVAG